jgi:hypothetical protein
MKQEPDSRCKWTNEWGLDAFPDNYNNQYQNVNSTANTEASFTTRVVDYCEIHNNHNFDGFKFRMIMAI